jgi:hypothetical protein
MLLSEQEIAALVSVLQRAPLLPAEVLAINAIVEKLKSPTP